MAVVCITLGMARAPTHWVQLHAWVVIVLDSLLTLPIQMVPLLRTCYKDPLRLPLRRLKCLPIAPRKVLILNIAFTPLNLVHVVLTCARSLCPVRAISVLSTLLRWVPLTPHIRLCDITFLDEVTVNLFKNLVY